MGGPQRSNLLITCGGRLSWKWKIGTKPPSHFGSMTRNALPCYSRSKARKRELEEERRGLLLREEELKKQQSSISSLQAQIDTTQDLLLRLEAKVQERTVLEERRNRAARETQASLQAENEALRPEMEALRRRIDTLESAEGASCPLCGQPLTPQHRKSTLLQLRAEGTEKGDRFRANRALMEETSAIQRELQSALEGLSAADVERLACSNSLAQLRERLQTLQKADAEWATQGKKRLKELGKVLEGEKYALEARKELTKVNKYLATLGYDAAAHDATRAAELAQRAADEEYRKLESARAAREPLESEITKSEIRDRQSRIGHRKPGI